MATNKQTINRFVKVKFMWMFFFLIICSKRHLLDTQHRHRQICSYLLYLTMHLPLSKECLNPLICNGSSVVVVCPMYFYGLVCEKLQKWVFEIESMRWIRLFDFPCVPRTEFAVLAHSRTCSKNALLQKHIRKATKRKTKQNHTEKRFCLLPTLIFILWLYMCCLCVVYLCMLQFDSKFTFYPMLHANVLCNFPL